MKIMRHFEIKDLVAIKGGWVPPFYDGFIYGHHGEQEDVVADLASTKTFLRYVNVLTFPDDSWHDPWFDWVRANVPPLANDKGIYALFPWYLPPRKLWDWSQMGIVQIHRLVQHLMDLREMGHGETGGFFLDQFWNYPHEWMFSPAGAPYSDFDPMKWYHWRRNIEFFRTTLRKRYLLRKEIVMVNGVWASHLMPCMFESAQRDPERVEGLYPLDKDNLVSVDARSARDVSWALALWEKRGNWISFGGPDEAAMEAAYRMAEQAQEVE